MKKNVGLSMPVYINNKRKHMNHKHTKKHDAPFPVLLTQYGKNLQNHIPPDTSKLLNNIDKTFIKTWIGILLFMSVRSTQHY